MLAVDIATLCQQLEGCWQLTRKIYDADTLVATVTGIAEFSVHAKHDLLYQEQGQLYNLDDNSFAVHRRYLYRQVQGKLILFFCEQDKDGVLFHALTFSDKNTATGEHQCKDDLYRAHYLFSLPDSFQTRYDVQGPHKDLVINSEYKR